MTPLMHRLFFLALALVACTGSSVPQPEPEPKAFVSTPRLTALAATQTDVFFVRDRNGHCELVAADRKAGSVRSIRELDFCPDVIRRVGSDSLILTAAGKSEWLGITGEAIQPDLNVVAATDRDHYAYVRDGHIRSRNGTTESDLGPASDLSRARLLADGSVVGLEQTPDGETLTRLTAAGRQRIFTSPLPAIESFDVSPDGTEIVFAAKRQSLDVGIVSVDGGEPRWVGTDPSDETTVTWAPRGNKVSWVIHTFGGDVVRTVHIPTAFSLLADTAGATVRNVAWEPEAEKFVYISSSTASSDEIFEIRYGGEARKSIVAPTAVADISLESWPEAGATSLLASPHNARYGHVYPLVIWVGGSPRSWSDARGAVWNLGGIGIASTSKLDEQFWDAAARLPWVDAKEVTVIAFEPIDPGSLSQTMKATVVAPDSARQNTILRDESNTVLTRVAGAGADVVESIAVRTIIRQRKGPAAADAKH